MKKFTPIAMKCNQEQFDAIRPKLEENGLKVSGISSFNCMPYLINNRFNENNHITNYCVGDVNFDDITVFEEWNEEIFLNACGIETVKTYELTAEQLNKLASQSNWSKKFLKELYPDAFEVELEVGKWYKSEVHLICFEKINGIKHYYYGFYRGDYYHNENNDNYITSKKALNNLCLATEQEVSDALIKEALKKYKVGDVVFDEWSQIKIKIDQLERFDFSYNGLFVLTQNNGKIRLLHNGKWSEIITETEVTQKELIDFYKKEKGIDNIKVVVK